MGRKSSSKNHTTPPVVPAQSRSGPSPVLLAVIAVAVIGVAIFAFWRGADTPAATATTANAATPAADGPKLAKGAEPTPEIIKATEAQAALGPHKQADLPPIPFQGYAPPRPVEVVTAAFQFAAEHPEVASSDIHTVAVLGDHEAVGQTVGSRDASPTPGIVRWHTPCSPTMAAGFIFSLAHATER